MVAGLRSCIAGIAGPWRVVTCLFLLALGLFIGCIPTAASAAVYWGAGWSIAGANLDGSNFDPEYIGAFDSLEIGQACGVAVDSAHIYWADSARNQIGRANLDGTDPEFAFITGADAPCGVAVDGRHIFWANTAGNSIGRANLDGSDVRQKFVTGMTQPCGVAVRGSLLYWASPFEDAIGIGLANEVGPIDRTWVEGAVAACGVAVDEWHIYWGSFGTSIGRSDGNGEHVEPSFITGLVRPCGIAINGSHLFWTEQADGGGWLGRARLDGSEFVAHLAANGGGCGPALDDQPFPLDPSAHQLPSEFSIGKVRHLGSRRDPVTFLAVDVPSAGEFDLDTTRGVGWNIVSDSDEEGDFRSAGRKWFAIWLKDTQAGSRLGRTISRRGRVGIGVTVRFTAAGHNETKKTRRLYLTKGLGNTRGVKNG